MKTGRVALVISLLMSGAFLFAYFSRYPLNYIPAGYEILGNTLTLPRFVIEPFIFLVILGIIVNIIGVFALRSSLAMGACVFYGAAIAMKPDEYPYIILECFICLIAAVSIREKSPASSDFEASSASSSDLRDSRARKKARASSPFYVLNADSELESAGKNAAPAIRSLNGKPVKQQSKVYDATALTVLAVIAMLAVILGVVIPRLVSGPQSRSTQSTAVSQTHFIPDLSGHWESQQAGYSTVSAEIDDNSVSVYWINKNGGKNLYWAGTYTPPKSMDESYSWMSVRDTSKTDGSAFSSKDDTMIFTYREGMIQFSAKIAGSFDMLFRLHRALNSD